MQQSAARDFWTHPDVSKFIESELKAIGGHLPNKVTWETLQAQIVCACGDTDIYPRFRALLFTLVTLLGVFRSYLQQRHGVKCWKQARAILRDNGRVCVGIGLVHRLSAATPRDAVEALTRIGWRRMAVRYRLPACGTSKIGGKDCGMSELVQVCRQLEEALALCSSRKAEHTSGDERDHGHSGDVRHDRVTMKLLSGSVLQLRFAGRSCRLEGLGVRMLISLYSNQGRSQSYEELWHFLHFGAMTYRHDKGGPPSALRTLKYGVNCELKKALGRPPRGADWIIAHKGVGYRLTQAVEQWVLLHEGRKNLQEVVRPASSIEGNKSTDDEE